MNNSEIIFQLPNSQCCHWGGNIIWSNFFEDFLLSVGDMEDNERAILNSALVKSCSPFKLSSLNLTAIPDEIAILFSLSFY